MAKPRNFRAVLVPRDCVDLGGWWGGAQMRIFFVRYYAHDGVLVKVQWWIDGHQCLAPAIIGLWLGLYFSLPGEWGS